MATGKPLPGTSVLEKPRGGRFPREQERLHGEMSFVMGPNEMTC